MKRILITGASGFVGSFLVEYGLDFGFEVTAGIRTSSSRKYLRDERIHIAELDMGSPEILVSQLQTLGRFDFVIHNAGITRAVDGAEFNRVNYQFTRNLVEALRDSDTIPDKFLFISSLAAFGPGNPTTLAPILLSDPPHPDTLYGQSKLRAEQYIMEQTDVPYLIFRPTGIYGPRDTDYFLFLKTVKQGFEFRMGRKKQRLTFIYVRDLARLAYLALDSAMVNSAYFVADGKVYDNTEYARIVKKHLGKKTLLVVTLPLGLVRLVCLFLDFMGRHFGFTPTLNRDKFKVIRVTNWACDTGPLVRDFRFRAEYDLDKGVEESVRWYQQEKWL